MKFLKTIVVASALSVLGVAAASASTVMCADGLGLPCVVDSSEAGLYGPSGDKEPNVEAALAAALGLDSIDLMRLGKYDVEGDEKYGSVEFDDGTDKSGSWSIDGMADYITVKAANQYAIYAVGGTDEGTWTTELLLTPNGKNVPGLSHITFWKGPSAEIPLPAAGFLLLGGLGALGIARRRKS